jgi:hypothetical protein
MRTIVETIRWIIACTRLDLNGISSSDTEIDEPLNRFHRHTSSSSEVKANKSNGNMKVNRMIVPTSTDERKLNALKKAVQQRPYRQISTSSSSRDTRPRIITSTTQAAGSSDDVDSLYDPSTNYTQRIKRSPSSSIIINRDQQQDTPFSMRQSIDSISTIQNDSTLDLTEKSQLPRQSVDCASVTSSEWGADDGISVHKQSVTPTMKCKK